MQPNALVDINSQIIREQPQPTLGMNPLKFALWLFIASIVMIFASLTSAYIVRRAEGNWLVFDLPPMLYVSTVLIIVSSATMYWAVRSMRAGDAGTSKMAVLLTTILGIAFTIGQFMGFSELVKAGVYFVGNPSGSFVYVLVGLHILHLVAGMFYLLIVFARSVQGKITANQMNALELCSIFWHFLGGLWVYLFLFLYINR